MTISQLDRPGGSVVNSWRLVGAWPRRWSGPAFDALEGGLAYEELELALDDLVWDTAPPSRRPGGSTRARIIKHVSGPHNAKGTDVAMEELTLAYERLELE